MEIVILCITYSHNEENNMPDCCEKFVSCFELPIYIFAMGLKSLRAGEGLTPKYLCWYH